MPSIKASKSGKARVIQARKEKGWVRDSLRWLEEASRLIDPTWRVGSPYVYGVSYGTWASFLAGRAINANAFKAYCQVLGLDWEEIVDRSSIESLVPETQSDWDEAPEEDLFYGRDTELQTLTGWILQEHCHLVALLGMGGIGKTCLSIRLAKQLQPQFDYVIWRSLRNTPPLEALLASIVRFLSHDRETEADLSRLMDYLSHHRCLIVLDNADSVLRSGAATLRDRAGYYLEGYEGYGELIRQLGEARHQSCMLLTSREKHREIAALEGATRPVRSLQLSGLTVTDGREIFTEMGPCIGTEAEWQMVVTHYAGNPLALKIAASAIHEILNGDISKFIQTYLSQSSVLLDDINDLLNQHFDRLSDSEKEVMYWLAIAREPITAVDLQEDLLSATSRQELLASLVSLRRRCLVERRMEQFTQQPVMMEYVINCLLEAVTQEILALNVGLLNRYALMKAQAKDHVRQSQIRLIIQPLIQRLLTHLESQSTVITYFTQLIDQLQKQPLQAGYAGGNLLNLLLQLGVDVRGYDFSNLAIWQADLRGQQLHQVDFTRADLTKSAFTQSFGSVLSIAASPDGMRLAVGDVNGNIYLWQLPDYKQLYHRKGHTNWVRSLAFSPNGDLLASGSSDHTVKLWQAETGRCLKTLVGHTSRVWAIAFSPDGESLVSAGNDCTVNRWDVQTGQLLQVLKASTSIRSVAFHPIDRHILVTGQEDGEIIIWNIDQEQPLRSLTLHSEPVLSLAFNCNGDRLVTGSSDQTLRLWRFQDGECLKVFEEHRNAVQVVAFNPTEQSFVSGGGDQIIRIWHPEQDESLKLLIGHTGRVNAITFIPHHSLLATGSSDQTIKLWELHSGQCVRSLQGYTHWSLSIVFSPDNQFVASGSNDTTVRLWDVGTGELIKTFTGHHSQVQAVAFSADGDLIASGSEDGTIKLWSVQSGACLWTLPDHDHIIWMISFSSVDRILASASSDGTVRVWDASTGECLSVLLHHTQVWSVAFSLDGAWIASGSDDGMVRLWNWQSGECLHEWNLHQSQVWRVAFSPDDQLISCGNDLTVKLVEPETGHLLNILEGVMDEALSVAFTADQRILVSDSSLSRSIIKIWDVDRGECLTVLRGHEDGVWSTTLSSDGQLLASTSRDETIRLWQVQTGECLATWRVPKPYEQMKITEVSGITEAQRETLKALGAVE
jgi:WD40 repeat protein/GTPase SAR1 family protein